jgi:uracil-DNA glycosylase family 4
VGALPQRRDRCEACPLIEDEVTTRGVPSFTYVQGRPDVFVVAEAPGEDEDAEGEPLVGSAGKVERYLLDRAGISSYAMGNVVRCRPTKMGLDYKGDERLENRPPTAVEIGCCLEYLKRDVARLRPRVLLLAGASSAHAVLGTKQPVVALRNRVHDVVFGSHHCSAIVSFHPSIVHYEPDKFTVLQEDRDFVARYLRGEPHFVPQKKWLYCDTVAKVKRAVEDCERHRGILVFDYETESLARVGAYPFCLGFGYQRDGVAYVYGVPLKHPRSPWSEREYQEVVALLRRLIRATQDPKRYRRPLKADGPVFAAHNCLAARSQVLLADGSYKTISAMVRDRDPGPVLSINADGELEAKAVVGWSEAPVRPWDDWLRVVVREKVRGRELRLTRDHCVITPIGRVRADQLRVGDRIYRFEASSACASTGQVIHVGPLRKGAHDASRYGGIRERGRVGLRQYCLEVEDNHNFFAGGLAVSNSKFEATITLDVFGERLCHTICTQQAVHALDENRLAAGRKTSPFALERVSQSLLGLSPDYWSDRVSDLLYSGRGKELEPREIADHCARDVAVEAALYNDVRSRCQREQFDVDRPFLLLQRLPYLLGNIERNGMPVDIDYLARLRSDKSVIRERLRTIGDDLNELPAVKAAVRIARSEDGTLRPLWDDDYGRFDVRDRNLLHTLFFDVLRLSQDKRTKSGLPAIDKEFLGTHAEGIDEAALVLEWRQLDKLASTYLESWWKFARQSSDNRIRSDYLSWSTNTGRLSSANPGMQQIPTRGGTEKAKKTAKAVKRVFRPLYNPKAPRVITSADFSQAEVRWLAEMSGDATLTKLFLDRAEIMDQYRRKPSVDLWKRIEDHYDMHRQVAALMYGLDPTSVTKENRQAAKAITFGIIYGMTIFGLAARLNVDKDEADHLLNLWLNQFSDAREWLFAQEDQACDQGWVENPIHRRRHLPALLILGQGRSSGAQHMKRVARNAPIQSIASDTTLWVAIQLQDYIDAHQLDWKIVGLVHDSIVSEIPWADISRYTKFVRAMASNTSLLAPLGVPRLRVPMEMDVEAGRSYGELVTLSINDRELDQQVEDMEETLLAA